MDELIKTFHIDWKLLIAQLVNFGIVLFVLWRFALKPLMKVMNKRSEDIEKSLKQAKEIEQKLQEADKTKEKIILEAKKESQNILEKTAEETEKMKGEKLKETKEEMEKMVKKTKADLGREKEKMVSEAKKEVGGLIMAVSSKIVERNLDDETNRKLMRETIKQIKE